MACDNPVEQFVFDAESAGDAIRMNVHMDRHLVSLAEAVMRGMDQAALKAIS